MRQIRDIEMIVISFLVADADNMELFGIQSASSVVLPSLEFGPEFYIDVLLVEVVNDIVDLLTFQGNGVATPSP